MIVLTPCQSFTWPRNLIAKGSMMQFFFCSRCCDVSLLSCFGRTGALACMSLTLEHPSPTPPPPPFPVHLSVIPNIRPCMADEHRCGDGTCILMEYLCDNRPDCRDMSDETNCGEWLQLGWPAGRNTDMAWSNS